MLAFFVFLAPVAWRRVRKEAGLCGRIQAIQNTCQVLFRGIRPEPPAVP